MIATGIGPFLNTLCHNGLKYELKDASTVSFPDTTVGFPITESNSLIPYRPIAILSKPP
jgi:hypothetical protein